MSEKIVATLPGVNPKLRLKSSLAKRVAECDDNC